MRYNKVYTAIIFAVVWLSSVLMTGVAFAQSQQPFPTQNQPGYSGQPGGQWQRPDQEGCVIQEIWHSRYAEGSSRLVIRLYNPDNENIRWNQNERVIVSDRNGRTYNTRVLKSEQNTIEFVIERLQSGEYYRIEIPDVYFRGTNCTVRGDFRAEDNWRYNLQDQEGWRYGPHDQQGFEIQEMWYRSGGRLAVKIYTPDNENIRWNQNERVIVRDRNGRTYNTRVLRAERNTIELVIERLRSGENYSIEIPGVYFRGMNYTVRGDFRAQDGWRYKK